MWLPEDWIDVLCIVLLILLTIWYIDTTINDR